MTEKNEHLSTLGEAALALARRGFAVVRLYTGGKEPNTAHGVKDATQDEAQIAKWWRERTNANIGIACGAPSGGLLVIDVDTGHSTDENGDPIDGMDYISTWEREHSPLPETVTATTASGGYHIYYRTTERIPNHVNGNVGIDFRGDGGYVVAPPSKLRDGLNPYAWECAPEEIEIAEADANVLAFVHSLIGAPAQNGKPFELPELIQKGERDDTLLRAGCSLRAKRVAPEIIAITLRGINAERCEPPMEPQEVEHVYQSVMSYEEGRSFETDDVHAVLNDVPTLKDEGVLTNKGKLIPADFASYLIKYFYVCHVNEYNGDLAIWDGAHYQTELLPRIMTDIYPYLSISEENETKHSLTHKAPKRLEADSRYIGFNNGIYDLDTGMFLDPTPDLLIVNTIPHDYDPDVDTTEIESVLNDYACGDVIVLQNLIEIIGACMWRSTEHAQCAILVGRGANGKSTYMNMLKAMLGSENYTSMDIHHLGEKFQSTHLAGCLADFADDTESDYLTHSTISDLKKAITGEEIDGEEKYEQALKRFTPYATFIISANEMPLFAETNEGIERRLHIVPFNAVFKVGTGKHDAKIKERLTSESACQQMIKLGLEGIHSLRDNEQFTPNPRSSELVHEIMTDSNSVLAWIENINYTAEQFDGVKTNLAWQWYKGWCTKNDIPSNLQKQQNACTSTILTKFPTLKTNRTGSEHKFVINDDKGGD